MRVAHAVLLTPPKSSYPSQLLSRQQPGPVSPLAATLMDLPASVANKRLTVRVSPLDATLTKNRGRSVLWLTTIPLTLTFGRSDLRTFASALISANSALSVPSALNPSFSFDFQLSTFDRQPHSTNHEIGFRAPHPIKSPHCPHRGGKWTGQMRTHHE
jgi:hypothetical protein